MAQDSKPVKYDFGQAATRIQAWYRKKAVEKIFGLAAQHFNYLAISIESSMRNDFPEYKFDLNTMRDML